MIQPRSMSLTTRRLVLTLFALCSLPLAAYAQSATATLSGTVEDQNKGLVPGARVKAVNLATGLERDTETNESGTFTIPLLPPSTYTVRVERDGFVTIEVSDVVLNVGDTKALLIQMKVGDVKEVVNVTGEAPLINESPAVGTTVDRQFVGNLPLNGRSFQSLIGLTPGVVFTPATGVNQGQFSVNGQRTNSNYFTIDGVSANIGVTPNATESQAGGGSLPGYAITGGTNNLVSVDALEEFKIQTSTYAPEFGRSPGAQISIVTRAGTNDFHGSAFEYFRNDALDANNWFNNARRLPKPATRQNQFGGVFSGPIVRHKTLFFFSYEGLRLRLPQSRSTDVPTLAKRQAAPATVRPLLEAFPVPNGPERLDAFTGLPNGYAEFVASWSNPSSLDATSIRIDHHLNHNMTLFGRYNYSPSEDSQRILGRVLTNLSNSANKTQTLTLGFTNSFTATMANEFRFNYSRNSGFSDFTMDDFGGGTPPPESALFHPSITGPGRRFNFSVFDILNGDWGVGGLVDNLQRQFNVVDNVTWVRGSHQTKFGLDYRRLSPVFSSIVYSLSYNFLSLSEALSGTPFLSSVLAGAAPREPVFHNFSLYGQDTWRVSPRLTVTYGLRWELNPPPVENNGNDPAVLIGLDNLATLTLAPFGTELYQTTYGNFAPRLGVAYEVSQHHGRETIVRGGFGIFYDLGTGTAMGPFVAGRFPYTATKSLSAVPLPLTAAQAAAPVPSRNLPATNQVYAFDPHLELPRTYQWNVALEQSLGSNQILSATYVGAAGRKLLRHEILNAPNPSFPVVEVTRNDAESDYKALQLQFQRRLSRGLQATASYTWAKAVDTASNDAVGLTPAAKIDPALDRGPADFDVRHALTGAITYDLPRVQAGKIGNAILRHWSLDTIFFARSALPINITYSRNVTGIGNFFSVFRPDLLPDIPLYLDDPTTAGGKRINNTINPANPRQIGPFVAPVEARQGNLQRNGLRGFPAYQLDFAVRRQFHLTERVRLQLKAEFFNIFNHPNFGAPSSGLGSFSVSTAFPQGRLTGTSASFGRPIAMLGTSLGGGGFAGGFNPLYQIGGPRSTQLSLRLEF